MANLFEHWFLTLYRWIFLMLWILVLAIVILLTPLGLKIGFIILSRTTPGEMHYQNVSGSLLGPLMIKRLTYRYQDQQFSMNQLSLQWRPLGLFAGKVLIDKVKIADLKINTPQAPTPTVEFSFSGLKQTLQDIRPQLTALRLPFILQVKQADIGNLVWQTHPGKPTVEATNVHGNDIDLSPHRLKLKIRGQLTQPYSLQAALTVDGTPENYHFNLNVDNPKTQWVVNCRVNPDEVDLDTQKALVFGGELDTHLIWKWATPMSWELSLAGRRLDLSVLKPDIPHPLDITLNSTGSLGQDRPHFSWNGVVKTRQTRVKTQGQYDKQWDIFWDVQVQELAELLPFASGALNSVGELHGDLIKPQTKGFLNASLLRWQDYRVDKLNAKWDLDVTEIRDSSFQLAAEQLFTPWMEVEKLQLSGQGKWAKHQLNLAAHGYQTDLTLGVSGGITNNRWQGSAQTFTIFTPNIGLWKMGQPTGLSISPQGAEVAALCLQSANKNQACLRGKWKSADNSWQFALTTRLDFAQITGTVPENFVVNLPIDFHLTAEGVGKEIAQAQLTGNGANGNIRYNGNQVIDTHVNSAKLNGKLDKNGGAVDLNLDLEGNNSLSASLILPKMTLATLFNKNQEISGKLSVNLNNLAAIQVLVADVINPRGKFQTQLAIGGTLGEPTITGNAALSGGEIKIPGLNIQLDQINLALNARGSELNYILTANSSNQPLRAVGRTYLQPNFPTEITLTGDSVLLANTPQYTVYVSPNVHFGLNGRNLDITGTINIPEAVVHQLDFERESTLPEDEVVLVGEHIVADTKPWKINTQLTVNLGNKVTVSSPGLKGKLQGSVTIISQPGQVVLAEGKISIVDGIYEIFGRQLNITPGSAIVYQKNPLSNPGLSVQAITRVVVTDPLSQQQLGTNEITIGMNIGGTSSSPQVTLFSSAGNLSQADMLSFLLLGTSSAGISPTNMNLMLQALNNLPLTKKGTSNVQGLTNQIKQGLGLTELGVESTPTLGPTGEIIPTTTAPTSYFVVGKRITSRIYFRYKYDPFNSINLFQLIYLLTRNWSLQLETDGSTQSGADLLYTIQTGTSKSADKTAPPPPDVLSK